MLAGECLLTMGTYGMIRFCLRSYRRLRAARALGACWRSSALITARWCVVQRNLKQLVA